MIPSGGLSYREQGQGTRLPGPAASRSPFDDLVGNSSRLSEEALEVEALVKNKIDSIVGSIPPMNENHEEKDSNSLFLRGSFLSRIDDNLREVQMKLDSIRVLINRL